MNTLFQFLEKMTEKSMQSKFNMFIYNIFVPIHLILEYIAYLYFWKKVIIPELLTNDGIVDFLDKNEFGYKKNKLYKSDLIESNEFFDRLSLEESKHVIKKEYVEAFAEIFKDNVVLNIEDYLTMIVTTEVKTITHQGEIIREKIYTVVLQFCRYYWMRKALIKSIFWLIIVGLLSVSGIYILSNQLIF